MASPVTSHPVPAENGIAPRVHQPGQGRPPFLPPFAPDGLSQGLAFAYQPAIHELKAPEPDEQVFKLAIGTR